MSEEKMLRANEIVGKPELLDRYTGLYLIVVDQALVSAGRFDNLNRAVNIAARKGWRPVLMSNVLRPGGIEAIYMYVMLENPKKT